MDLIQIFTGFLGSLGFGILFHIRGRNLIVASLGGLMSWAVFLLLEPLLSNEATRYFLSSAAVTIYAEIFARVMKTPTTTFLVPSLIPLIPGGALYYTMNYALNEQWSLFAAKAIYTLELALALALGILAMTTLTRMTMVITKKLRGREFVSLFHHNL
jgi:uncharacterized membrane protein YjjB (DUF3815 family)